MIKVTEKAANHLKGISDSNDNKIPVLGLRGGGCAGFEYDWGTISDTSDINKGDELITTEQGNNFIIGSHSIMFMVGTVVDYKKDIMGSMFDIQNPNAQSSCGCGVSVNFDMDKLAIPLEMEQ